MLANNFELINIIYLILSIYLINKCNVINSIIVFASYFLFHYSSFYIPIIIGDYSIDNIYNMRILGSGIVSKTCQIILITTLVIKIESLLNWNSPTLKFYIVINILMAVGFITKNIENGGLDSLSIQYYLSLCLYVWIILISNRTNDVTNFKFINSELLKSFIIYFLIIIIILGLYEIWLNKAYAQTQVGPDLFVYRSSSIFYNPNLFAYYCSLGYFLLIHYSESEIKTDYKNHVIAIALIFCIFISGSRSIYILLLISVTLISILNKKIKLLYFYPLVLLIISGFVIIGENYNLSPNFDNKINLYQNFYLLFQRFFNIPYDLIIFLTNKFNVNIDIGSTIATDSLNTINTQSINSQLSIEGRFCKGCDNGWIILYRDLGIFGLLAFLLLYSKIFIEILVSKNKLNNKIIFVNSIFFIILVGLVMRFQILTVTIVSASYISILLFLNKNK